MIHASGLLDSYLAVWTICGVFEDRQMLEDAGDIAIALKVSKKKKKKPNFKALKKDDKALWDRVGGIRKQYLSTGDRAEKKWREIKLIVTPKAAEVLREAGKGLN